MLVRRLLRLSRTAKIHHIRCLSSSFCTTKTSLSPSAQQAVWATAIIQKIKDSRNFLPKDYNSKTISQLIIEMDDPKGKSSKYIFDKQNKDKVMTMFKTGIYLNTDVFSQTRVSGANSTNKSQTKFFPNFIVTPQIFEALQLIDRQANMIIYGGYGISKTFSIIFYKILMEYNTKFWMQAKNDEEKQRQKNKLIEQGLLKGFCWKYWYWTISEESILQTKKTDSDAQHILSTSIKKVILQQANQLSEREKEDLKSIHSFEKFKEKLISYYKNADIKSRAVIDQINAVASKMRQCNTIKKVRLQQQENINNKRRLLKKQELSILNISNEQIKYIEKKNLQLDQEQKQSIEKFKKSQFYSWIEPTKKLLLLVQSFRKMDKSYIFNSSLNIQLDLLKDQGDNFYSFNSILGHHTKFNQVYIKYQEQLYNKEWGKIDFWKFFQSQFSKRLEDFKFSQAIQKKITLSLRKIFQNIPIHTYYRPLYARQYLSYQKLQNIVSQNMKIMQQKRLKLLRELFNNKTEQENFMKIFNQLMNMFEEYCRERCIQNVNKFINKGTQDQINMKKKFIEFLYFLAEQKNSKIDQKDQTMCFLKEDFISLFQAIGYDITQFFRSRSHNKQFLSVNQDKSYIEFAWSAKQFSQIGFYVINKDAKQVMNEFWTQTRVKELSQNQTELGIHFQKCLLKALEVQSQMNLKLYLQKKNLPKMLENMRPAIQITLDQVEKSKSKKQYDYVQCRFKIKKRVPFHPYNHKIQLKTLRQPDLLYIFRNIIDAADQNPLQYVLGEPNIKDKPINNSKVIDFIIFRRSDAVEKRYQLLAFDSTVTFDRKQVLERLRKNRQFMNLIKKSFEQMRLQCTIIYIPICLRENCKIPKRNTYPENFACGVIEDLTVDSLNKAKKYSFLFVQKVVSRAYLLNKYNQLEQEEKVRKIAKDAQKQAQMQAKKSLKKPAQM